MFNKREGNSTPDYIEFDTWIFESTFIFYLVIFIVGPQQSQYTRRGLFCETIHLVNNHEVKSYQSYSTKTWNNT